ncbi:MAG: hypothetical protein QXE95_06405 [Candidatus Nitrosocaldus sp.]
MMQKYIALTIVIAVIGVVSITLITMQDKPTTDISTTGSKQQEYNETVAKIEGTSYFNPGAQFWNRERTRTGEPYILALEISPPHPDRKDIPKEAKYGELPWLDKAIDNVGKNTRVSDAELEEFFKYTEDGNTDFKVYLRDGTVKFYRLYYMEVP